MPGKWPTFLIKEPIVYVCDHLLYDVLNTLVNDQRLFVQFITSLFAFIYHFHHYLQFCDQCLYTSYNEVGWRYGFFSNNGVRQ